MKSVQMRSAWSIKALTMLMAVVMMLGMLLPVMSVHTHAAAPTTFTVIHEGDTPLVEFTSTGQTKYFKFVPTKSDIYYFYSSDTSRGDPYGKLLDASGVTLVEYNDGIVGKKDFLLSYECVAGSTYYIAASSTGYSTASYKVNVEAKARTSLNTTGGSNVYSLFNSNRGSSAEKKTGNNQNDYSYDNHGYDLYAAHGTWRETINLGLSFTICQQVTERATLSVYAYDTDETSGERDLIYLVDETTNTRTQIPGYLGGMNEEWNTTTMYIDASMFTVGHTYHFELTEAVEDWEVYVRTVSLALTTAGGTTVSPILDHNFTATISNTGLVSTNLYLKTNTNTTYTLEYAATHGSNQHGSALNQTIAATTTGTNKAVSFQLESGSPNGIYQIYVIVKNAANNPIATYTTTAGYNTRAVTYSANGGSNNLPVDTNAYTAGDTVTVLFNYIPTRYGYDFLGWSTSSTATTPTYTAAGLKTFTMGSFDVTLYAVWGVSTTPSVPVPNNGKVLLVQDAMPWSHIANNATATLLGSLLTSGKITAWNQVTTSQLNATLLNDYAVVYIANDQSEATYQTLASYSTMLTNYVDNGGILIYGACINGYNGSALASFTLPGGAVAVYNTATNNYIANASHPIVLQTYSSGAALTNTDLVGMDCSNVYFTSLPTGYNTILKDASSRPTLVEYPLGDGYVLASGLAWECYYTYETANYPFSSKAFDDLFLYALALSGSVTTHTHVAGGWIVDTPADCQTPGSRHKECSCGYVMVTEPIPVTDHLWQAVATQPKTCTVNGYIDYSCGYNCGATKRETLVATGHEYGSDNICDECGHIKTQNITIESVTACPGETVTIVISADSLDPVKSMAIEPVADDRLELISGVWLNPGYTGADWNAITNDAVTAYVDPTNINGDIFVLTYRIKDTVPIDSLITVKCNVIVKGFAGGVEYPLPITVLNGEIRVQHIYSSSWTSDATGHWQTCTLCGHVEQKFAHNHTNSCDTTCNTCGYVRPITHTFGTVLAYDADQHWKECSVCHAKEAFAPHTWDNGTLTSVDTALGTGIKRFECTACDAHKDENVTVYRVMIDDAETYVGGQLTLNIKVDSIPAVKSMIVYDITYDKTALTLTGATWSSAVSSATIKDWDSVNEIATLSFDHNTPVSGTILTLTFDVDMSASGDYDIGCSVVINKAEGANDVPVDSAAVSGTVSVAQYLRGDVNGDGVVNSDDAIHLLRHYLMSHKYSINQNGDMDGNGTLDSNDSIYLLRYTMWPNKYPLAP